MSGRVRRRIRERRFADVMECAHWGLPVCPAAYPMARRCSCQRLSCSAPAAHPTSSEWRREASTDPGRITSWLNRDERFNFASPTGRVHDALDVSARVGMLALRRLEDSGAPVGPVAASGDGRYQFLTASRGLPVDENEWWPCDLDCRQPGGAEPSARPGSARYGLDDHSHEEYSPDEYGPVGPGSLRWHSRGSYVLVPPSVRACGQRVRWVRSPDRPLPDPLRVLDVLVDAQETISGQEEPPRRGPSWSVTVRLF